MHDKIFDLPLQLLTFIVNLNSGFKTLCIPEFDTAFKINVTGPEGKSADAEILSGLNSF
jgi:hypothetical protein